MTCSTSRTAIRERAYSICQAKVHQQSEEGSEVIMRVVNHALKSVLEWLSGIHEEREHISGQS